MIVHVRFMAVPFFRLALELLARPEPPTRPRGRLGRMVLEFRHGRTLVKTKPPTLLGALPERGAQCMSLEATIISNVGRSVCEQSQTLSHRLYPEVLHPDPVQRWTVGKFRQNTST